MINICGLNKTTLLDYPGHVAATVFLGGCNFRCPFCHNSSLVLNPSSIPAIPTDEFWDFLNRRKNIITGVCISGGEPTLYDGLTDFIKQIRSYNLKIKLDTNGYHPDVLNHLIENDLVDMISMDIKGSKSMYPVISGVSDIDMSKIEKYIKKYNNADTLLKTLQLEVF